MDDSISSLHEEKDRGINNLIISSVLLSIAKTRSDIHAILSKTLLKTQENRLGINLKEIVDKALVQLLKTGVLRVKKENASETFGKANVTVFFPTQTNDLSMDENNHLSPKNAKSKKKKTITLMNSTELELCPLGRAAMKGAQV